MCFMIDYQFLSERQEIEINNLKREIDYLKREQKTDKEILKQMIDKAKIKYQSDTCEIIIADVEGNEYIVFEFNGSDNLKDIYTNH